MKDNSEQNKHQSDLSSLSEADKWRLYNDLKSALEPHLTMECNRSQICRTLADILGI